MTITVIGHLCIDEIHLPENEGGNGAQEKLFGGIFYSLATLANLVGPGDRIQPVLGVGEQEYESFKKSLESLPGVDTKGIYKFKGSSNHVHLFYKAGKNNRIECSNHIAEPIPFSRIKQFLDADGILINMVSGFDITLETLDSVRMAVRDARTPIHFDFHSLTLGIDPENKRFRRPVTDWRRWCFMLNSVQMSEHEALGLTAEHFDEQTLVNHLMPLMVNALVITRGERGVSAILQENKKLTRHDFPAVSSGPTIDPTGCGDVFGAAFLYHYILRKNYRNAAEFANRVAGVKSTFKGTDGLSALAGKLTPDSVVR